jgi:hypothetical protein
MINANLILCDAAQAYEGKLSILGGGWIWIKVGVPFGIGIIVDVPWDKANTKLPTKLELFDEDGNPVCPDGTNPLVIFVELEVGRPVGQLPGSNQRVPLAFNFQPLIEKPGRYEWRLSIDDYITATSISVVTSS